MKLRSLAVGTPGQRFEVQAAAAARQSPPSPTAAALSGGGALASVDAAPEMEASHSYAWLLTVLDHFCGE